MLGPAARTSGSILVALFVAGTASAAAQPETRGIRGPADAWTGSVESVEHVPTPVSLAAAIAPNATCAAAIQQGDDDDRKRSRWRVLGWLYRAFRHGEAREDPPLLLYLRSPLLAGFADEADECPDSRKPAGTPRCEAVAVIAHKEGARTVDAVLPQLGASSPAELIAAVQTRLEAGAVVTLRTTKGRPAVLTPAAGNEVVITACDDAGAPDASGGWDVV